LSSSGAVAFHPLADTKSSRLLAVPGLCHDGAPPVILVHIDCDHGVCGWSCLPDRWTRAPAPE
jgi:hypothetical protein